ncbi:DNA translocase FtsK [Puniceibacterium sp. IMCC21224]|uniref:DNA translocase FtsK n=1 Tax=Puniceibacterium sp. IMCC21224 TaxID=1618204 RepID=UPI00064DB97E|nr:DNA translocase FtsK [Puniceibacterium sp. IMCC21224]KMK65571.1 DNA translocase FtsK [Puniceibacterium sp. IMCC21224]
MAYQARGRDPLFDTNMQAAIEKRGKELVGLGLMVLGLMAAAMIASYTPDDPSWLSATDAPVQNWMGRIGASIAAPLFMIVGWGSWGLALVLIVWGVRMMLHRGDERAVSRLIFAPIWVALAAVYAAGQTVGPEWNHSFGLGGLFGDMMMGSFLGVLPMGASIGLKLAMLVLGAGIVALGAFVLGFTKVELRNIGRFLAMGLVMTYATLLNVLGRGANGAVRAAFGVQAAHIERRERRRIEVAEAEAWAAAQEAVPAVPTRRAIPGVRRTEPLPVADLPEEPMAARPVEKTSFLSRMPALIKRPDTMPEPELVEHELPDDMDLDDAPGDDRIRAKIADVIKARIRATPEARIAAEAPLTKGRGRRPDPLIVNTQGSTTTLRPEPPLTARHAAAQPRVEPVLTATRAAPVAAVAAAPVVARVAHVPSAPIPEVEQYEPEPNVAFEAYEDEIIDRDQDDYAADDGYDALSYAAEAPVRAPIPVAQPKKVVQQVVRKPVPTSRRAQEEAQPSLKFDETEVTYELPPLNLLMNPDTITRHHLSDEALEENARMLESVLDDYGVKGEIVSVRPGPVVTMYELEPAPGLKASRVIGLADDIARSMSALSARVSTVPGRSVIGIELPNDNREMVGFREILSTRDYGDGNQKLPLALGKDIGGDPIVANLAKMPHLLIAGTTGSGKSVAINTMILSLLYKLTPEDCRMIMIDPKMLELSVYDGIPHLLSPVVTDPKKAVVALKWVVGEMEERYRKMSKMGVRNIDGYNGRVADALGRNEMFERTVQTGFDDDTGEPIFESEEFEPKKMPYIVVIVDEMADLMMVAGKEIEACIQRLAQMARASGIHLIMATQRPSVDVITGTIKANFPTRISFQVTSKIDSRTILGEMGAEQLLGMGDMLYMAGGSKIIRCHGPFVSDEEVEEVVNHLKAFGPPSYIGSVVEGADDEREADIDAVLGLNTGGNTDGEDALYDTAVAIVVKDRKCSTSYIQRKLAIGYNKAARLVEQMEDEGVVSSANHVGKREILVPEQH